MDDRDDKKKQQDNQTVASHNMGPEHEPFRYHFDTSGFDQLPLAENNEADNTPKETSPVAQYTTQPAIQQTQPQPTQPPTITHTVHTHPPLPLTDEEIEGYSQKGKSEESLHWLALWCVRQLEIYEREINKDK